MNFNPLVDFSDYSDEVLLEKINELGNKLSVAHRTFMSPQIINQLQATYQTFRMEQQERLQKQLRTKIVKDNPKLDPNKPLNIGELDDPGQDDND